jgi:DNA-binding LacI/PurR family transcriptional regulator
VAQPANELGRAAVELIVGRLRGTTPDVATLMAGEVVVRSSAGPPPA